jgi:CheY-like chemotaxis protein
MEALRFFARPDRLELPLVLVSDYAMPAETGLSLCARHRYPGLQRILLTGVADTQVAVSAFNAGVIEQYVRKQSRTIAEDITSALQGRVQASAERRGAQLASAFAPEFSAAFDTPGVQHAMRALFDRLDIREYMMLGSPQGVLGITSAGEMVWVQLETSASLQELDDIVRLAGVEPASARRVAHRECLVAADFMQQAGRPPTEAPVQVLCSAPLLLAALHPLGPAPVPGSSDG